MRLFHLGLIALFQIHRCMTNSNVTFLYAALIKRILVCIRCVIPLELRSMSRDLISEIYRSPWVMMISALLKYTLIFLRRNSEKRLSAFFRDRSDMNCLTLTKPFLFTSGRKGLLDQAVNYCLHLRSPSVSVVVIFKPLFRALGNIRFQLSGFHSCIGASNNCFNLTTYKYWRSQRESNPCFSLERPFGLILLSGPPAWIIA